MKKETKHSVVFWCSLMTALVALIAAAVIVAFQLYVRWKVNQNFTFLGGFELEALTIMGAGLLAALYLKREQ
ncbi:MAG: hypothetical protein WC050_04835 [Candidatus Paceibacterota bacterium]